MINLNDKFRRRRRAFETNGLRSRSESFQIKFLKEQIEVFKAYQKKKSKRAISKIMSKYDKINERYIRKFEYAEQIGSDVLDPAVLFCVDEIVLNYEKRSDDVLQGFESVEERYGIIEANVEQLLRLLPEHLLPPYGPEEEQDLFSDSQN